MKFVYVLVADRYNAYCDMLYISCRVAREMTDIGSIEVLLSRQAEKILTPHRFLFEKIGVRFTAVDTPDYKNLLDQSRHIKTQMRLLVDGEFLFCDVDTLPVNIFRRDLESCRSSDFAACRDRNFMRPYLYSPRYHADMFETLGWAHPMPRYFNSGVIYWGDTAAAQDLCAAWHRDWHKTRELGVSYDQPSLNRILNEHSDRYRLKTLPKCYNAMVDASPWLARKARILHFYTRNGMPRRNTVLFELINAYQATGAIDWSLVEQARSGGVWSEPPHLYEWLKGIGFLRRALHIAKRKEIYP
ncbi:MAG: putative nucleotide-diphospho-sugar transferase [Planctomycetota bacterium]